jgi:hypothetical protein
LEGDRRLRIEIWGRDAAQQLLRLKSILKEFRERDSDVKSIQ